MTDSIIGALRVYFGADTVELETALGKTQKEIAQVNARMQSMSNGFARIGGALAAVGVGMGTAQIIEYANAWTRVDRSIAASQDIFGMQLNTSSELLALANEARVDLESYAKMYTRTAAAIRDYGMGASEAAKVTTALSMALKLGGTTAEEQSSVLLQFSQALNKGKLDGDEFRTVMEAAPVVVQLLSDKLKISKGEIINWAKSGKLGVKELVSTLVDGGGKIDRIFKGMPVTVDEAFIVLRNSVTGYIGRLDAATGASQTFVVGLSAISNNIDTVANSALVLGAALLSAFGPRTIGAVAGFGVATTAAMGPIGTLAAILGGGAAAIALFGDQVATSADGMVTLKDTASAVIDVVGGHLAPLAQQAGDLWWAAVQKILSALAGVPVSFEDIVSVARQAINVTIGLFTFAAKSIAAAFQTLPAAVAEKMIDVANGVIAIIERMVARVKSALDMIPGIKIEAEVDLGRLANPLAGAGAQAREAMAAAGAELGRDFVGEFGQALSGIGNEIAQKAKEIAELRRWAAGTSSAKEYAPRKAAATVDTQLVEKMRRADQRLQDLYAKSLEAAGRHTEAVIVEFSRELGAYRKMLDDKLITQEQFDLARQRLTVIAGQHMQEAIEKEYRALRDTTDIVASGMADAFSKFTESGKLDVKEMTRSIIADFAKIIFQKNVLDNLFGTSGKGFGLTGDALGVGSDGSIGSLFKSLPGFADGGRPAVGMPSWVGERGKELFVPDQPGTIIPNHMLGGLQGSSAINLNIDARGATVDAVTRLKAELPRMILQTVSEARERNIIR